MLMSNADTTDTSMHQRILTAVLLVGLFFCLATLAFSMSAWRLPDHEQGYAPVQPIGFSHRLHAGELAVHCQFCHSGAARSRHAGIPSTDVCMKCHKIVTSPFDVLQDEQNRADKEKRKPRKIISPELRKLYDTLALDENLRALKGKKPTSIPWVKVHNLPDHVRFDHRAHVAVGVSCQQCHGPVESMERMKQHSSLTMGWCVNCHRKTTQEGVNGRAVHASTSCAVCHY